MVNLGEAYLEKGDYATARPYLDRALTLRPEGSEALVDIGYIYDARGDWKTAIGYYNRAIRSDPLRPEAYIDLGYDYNEHRLFPLAEAAYIKGHQRLAGRRPAALHARGDLQPPGQDRAGARPVPARARLRGTDRRARGAAELALLP